MATNPAIFINKDGTLLADIPHNVDPRRMHFAPGSRAGLTRLAALQMPLIVVTDQPGIVLGKLAPENMSAVRDQLEKMFLKAGRRAGCRTLVCAHANRRRLAGRRQIHARNHHQAYKACTV